MIYKSSHITVYDYVDPVSLCHNVLHLTARNGPWQTRQSSELRISPPPSVMTDRIDFFGNTATFATIEEPHRKLRVTAINLTEIEVPAAAACRSHAPVGFGSRPVADRPCAGRRGGQPVCLRFPVHSHR